MLYNKLLNDWSRGKQLILVSLDSQCRGASGNIEVLGKQNGPVIKVLIIGSAASGQDEVEPVLLLASRAGKISQKRNLWSNLLAIK